MVSETTTEGMGEIERLPLPAKPQSKTAVDALKAGYAHAFESLGSLPQQRELMPGIAAAAFKEWGEIIYESNPENPESMCICVPQHHSSMELIEELAHNSRKQELHLQHHAQIRAICARAMELVGPERVRYIMEGFQSNRAEWGALSGFLWQANAFEANQLPLLMKDEAARNTFFTALALQWQSRFLLELDEDKLHHKFRCMNGGVQALAWCITHGHSDVIHGMEPSQEPASLFTDSDAGKMRQEGVPMQQIRKASKDANNLHFAERHSSLIGKMKEVLGQNGVAVLILGAGHFRFDSTDLLRQVDPDSVYAEDYFLGEMPKTKLIVVEPHTNSYGRLPHAGQ